MMLLCIMAFLNWLKIGGAQVAVKFTCRELDDCHVGLPKGNVKLCEPYFRVKQTVSEGASEVPV